MSAGDTLAASLEALRAAFDASFAAAPSEAAAEEVALLVLRTGGERMALRVRDIDGLLKAGKIVPVPSRRPELLGITGIRGAVVPVYSLAMLVGRPQSEPPRWIALAGGAARVGLAFAAVERHVRVAPERIHAAAAPGAGASTAAVTLDSQPLPILDIPAIARAITQPSGRGTGRNT